MKIDCPVIEVRANDLKDVYGKNEGKAGVYCWGYYEEDTFIPLYVGKSRNVHERLLQHYCRFRSGEYRLFTADELRRVYIYKSNVTDKFDSVYIPTSFKSVIEDLPNHKSFHDLMVANFALRYIHIKEESDRVHAERSLANHIGRGRLLTSVPIGGDHTLSDDLMLLVAPQLP